MATYYLDGNTLANSSVIYTDVNLTSCAPDGYYSDGIISRQQVSCVLSPAEECTGCPKIYKILDCITDKEYYALGTFFFSLGDVVKYKVGAGGGTGVDEYGTIVSILFSFVVLDATIQSNGTFACGG
jgi:hypothetical protein